MGDWTYYSTLMQLSEVAERIRPAQEIHKSDTLCDMIQRSLSKRLEDISKYILRQPQHLFNSIIVGIYEGDPQWYELDATSSQAHDGSQIPSSVLKSIGSLHLTGTEKIFALDGQHRVAGIKEALVKRKSLGTEQLSVIFVAHRNDRMGLQRSRRLFATLNRYAKPVSRLEIIALDEDDPIAITTRALLRDHTLLSRKNVIAIPKGKNMPTGDDEAFTTAVALYEGLLSFFATVRNLDKTTLREFLADRPNEQALGHILTDASKVVDLMIAAFPELSDYKKVAGYKNSAAPFRNPSGGHFLFRPIGLLAYMLAVGRAVASGATIELATKKIARSKLSQLNQFPWAGVLFDSNTGTMKASSGKGALDAYATLILLNAGLHNAVGAAEKKNCRTVLTKALVTDGATLSGGYKRLFNP